MKIENDGITAYGPSSTLNLCHNKFEDLPS